MSHAATPRLGRRTAGSRKRPGIRREALGAGAPDPALVRADGLLGGDQHPDKKPLY
jgi:hypothetical protein